MLTEKYNSSLWKMELAILPSGYSSDVLGFLAFFLLSGHSVLIIAVPFSYGSYVQVVLDL